MRPLSGRGRTIDFCGATWPLLSPLGTANGIVRAWPLGAVVDQACRAVIERPHDAPARDVLLEAFAPVAVPGFFDGSRHPPSLQGLLRQTAAFADIVRQRIASGRSAGESEAFGAMHVGNGTRELQTVVSDLLQELDKEKDV